MVVPDHLFSHADITLCPAAAAFETFHVSRRAVLKAGIGAEYIESQSKPIVHRREYFHPDANRKEFRSAEH